MRLLLKGGGKELYKDIQDHLSLTIIEHSHKKITQQILRMQIILQPRQKN